MRKLTPAASAQDSAEQAACKLGTRTDGSRRMLQSIPEDARAQLPSSAREVFLVYNPMAGSADRREQIDALSKGLCDRAYKVTQATSLQDLQRITDQARANDELRCVVAAGGDGTAEAVANHTSPDTPIAVLPLGTENLLAKYLGLTEGANQLIEAIDQGTTVTLDAGELIPDTGSPSLFLLMLGCGFDAEVIRRLHEQRAGHITHLSYAKPLLDAIREYRYPKLRVSCWSDATREKPDRRIEAHFAFVFNTPSYAIGLPICPEADPFDGSLHVKTFRGGSFLAGMLHFGSILLRRHNASRRVQTMVSEKIRIESDQLVPFQVDGDPGGTLPVEIRVCRNRLRLILPASGASNFDWNAGGVES